MLTLRARLAHLLSAISVLAVMANAAAQETVVTLPGTPATPASHMVKKSPFQIDVEVSGVFESAQMTEVAIPAEEWALFSVLEAVALGTQVNPGDALVRLETVKIDEAIRDLEKAREIAALTLQQTEEELRALIETTPLDLASAERDKLAADEELKHYLEVAGPLSEKTVEYSLKSSRFYVESAEEELKQLQQMYGADDLTEETEEIILKRARNDADNARFSLESSLVHNDRTLKVELPRRKEQLTESARRHAIALQQARTTLPLAANRRRLELEKLKDDHQKSGERLDKLRKDRSAMTVVAPTAGIVYFGRSTRGRWPEAATIGPQLRAGGSLMPQQTFITIVSARPIFVRVDLAEKDLQFVRPEIAGRVTPTARPNLKLAGKVASVSAIPITDGTFDVRIDIVAGEEAAAIMPGMTCTVKLVGYRREDAITVPKAAVFSDELDADKRYVFVVTAEGGHERRDVTTGNTSGDKTEITAGLEEGSSILLEKPAK